MTPGSARFVSVDRQGLCEAPSNWTSWANDRIVDVLEPQAILCSVLVNEQGVCVLYHTVCIGPSARRRPIIEAPLVFP
jgi:hypothetical protein